MRYALLYEAAPDFLSKVPAHVEAHRAMWARYRATGTLLLIGPFLDPPGGALAVFTTRDAAEAFAAEDPFVRHGVVARWTVREWQEVLGG